MMRMYAKWTVAAMSLVMMSAFLAACQPPDGGAAPEADSGAADSSPAQPAAEPAAEPKAANQQAAAPKPQPAPANNKLKLTAPNGGEIWRVGREFDVTWNAKDIDGDVGLDLRKDGEFVQRIAWRVPATEGSYTWRIHTETYEPGEGYTITVFSRADESIKDVSDKPFRIGQFVRQDGEENGGEEAAPAE